MSLPKTKEKEKMTRPYKSAIKSELQKEIDIEIGKRLRQARASRQIEKLQYDKDGNILNSVKVNKPCTQMQLANVLDCSFQQIQKFEHGKNTLSLYKTFQVCCFFNLEIEQFTNIYQLRLYPSIKQIFFKDVETKLVGQYEPPINSSDKDRDCSLSSEL